MPRGFSQTKGDLIKEKAALGLYKFIVCAILCHDFIYVLMSLGKREIKLKYLLKIFNRFN